MRIAGVGVRVLFDRRPHARIAAMPYKLVVAYIGFHMVERGVIPVPIEEHQIHNSHSILRQVPAALGDYLTVVLLVARPGTYVLPRYEVIHVPHERGAVRIARLLG